MSNKNVVTAPSTLSLVVFFAHIVAALVYRAITYPFRAVLDLPRAPTFKKDIIFASIRAYGSVTIAQTRHLRSSTTQEYHKFCDAENIAPRSLDIEVPSSQDVVSAHWIGEPDAEIVVLYFTGGGYTQPGTDLYLKYFARLVRDLKGASGSVAVLQLAYTLAPEAQYPQQLREAAAALAQLLRGGRAPRSIVLAGDSAGGNLLLSLLSHMLHPHPDRGVANVEMHGGRLGGMLLISPWVSFGQEYKSFARNRDKDFVPELMLRKWAGMFLAPPSADLETDPGPVHGDSYNEPLVNEATWWEGLPGLVDDVFVWYGGNEVFADAIAEFEAVFRKGWGQGGKLDDRVVFVQSPGKAHIEPVMSMLMEPDIKGEHQTVIEDWLRARLANI